MVFVAVAFRLSHRPGSMSVDLSTRTGQKQDSFAPLGII